MVQLSQSQVQKLSQELRLTPQQILQSTILQLTTLALEARVTQELEQNPVLEEVEPEERYLSDDNEYEPGKEADTPESDIDWDEILPQNDDYQPKIEYDREQKSPRQTQAAPRGLVDHINDQLKLLNLNSTEEQVAAEIIWNLDERGYLAIPIENIAFSFEIPIADAEKVLRAIQHLDPPGLGARDLRECLLIQLSEIENAGDAITLIRNHFDDFANKRYPKIIKALGWEAERLQAAQDIILKLNPKPGASLAHAEPDYIVPDLIVEKIGDDFIIEVNDARVPELRISSSYLDMLARGNNLNNETKLYLKKKIDLAKWFIQSIYQRRMTMIRVMKAIIARQRDFFEDPKNPLRPMILKDIAEDVHMDISTISRVSNGKYVQLSSGIYELKYFFNEGMLDESGEEVSTRIIKDRLRQLVDAEDKRNPASDDQLAAALKKDGFPVARRTVAKYREQLKIPVARLRREI